MTPFFPSFGVLLIGIRPKTLSMSLMPILVATSFAFQQDVLPCFETLLAIIFASLSIQIATNLHNDAQDYLNGTDKHTRIGPQRITQSQLANPTQTKNAAFGFFFIAILCGLYLIWLGGLMIAVIGLACLMAAYGYSAGPLPISRGPLGELFVLNFFGIIAVSTTYYLLSGTWSLSSIILGICVGSPASAVLLVNNTRDTENDRMAGRKTLSILIGETASKWLYSFLMILPFLIIPLFNNGLFSSWLIFIALPFVFKAVMLFFTTTEQQDLNKGLSISAACQVLICCALSIGLILDKKL
jgi:1,4-dihydroxy-2-naphthoate polyprenyltransferase